MLQTSLNVYSLKFYHSCVKASSIDFSHLSIISARRSARSFANGCEKHLLRTLDFLTQSEKWGINDTWGPSLILFLFFQFLLFFPPDLSDRVVVSPSLRFPHTSNFFCYDMRPVSSEDEVVVYQWWSGSVDRWGSVSVDRWYMVGDDWYCLSWDFIDFTSTSQPSLRSYCKYMIIKYPRVRT